MTRLRFNRCEGVLLTNKIVAGKNMLEVMIMAGPGNSQNALFYKDGSIDAFKKITDNNLTKLKKLVKKELKTLGVKFEDEVRPRLKGKIK